MENKPEIIESFIKFPLSVDLGEDSIVDSYNQPVLQVRGWGWMQKLERPFDKVRAWQSFVVDTINRRYDESVVRAVKQFTENSTYGKPKEEAPQIESQATTIRLLNTRIKKLEGMLKRNMTAFEDLGNQRTSEGRTGDLANEIRKMLNITEEE